MQEALRRHPRNLLIGVGAHIADSAAVLPAAACLVSLVAFVAAPQTKDIDIADAGAR